MTNDKLVYQSSPDGAVHEVLPSLQNGCLGSIFYVQGILCSVGGSSVCRAEAGGARSSEAGIAPGPIPGPWSASRSPALHLLLESALPFLPLEREGILRAKPLTR